MKKVSRILSVLLVLCMILSMIPAVFAEGEKAEFTFLVTSDLHGQIYATDYTVDYEQHGTYKRGLTRVASYVKEVRKEYGENVFLADLGDTIQGAPLTYYYAFNKPEEDDPAVKALRTMGYDLWVVGNHEFNYGKAILDRQLDYATSAATETESQVNVCVANYLDNKTNSAESKDWATWKGYDPYIIKEFDGVKVAIIGLGNPNIAKWDVPANWDGIYFADIVETYKHYEPEMKEKADMIVVMAHDGLNSEAESQWDSMTRLIQETDSIDFAFSGHEHGNQVATVKNAKGEDVPVLQPYTKARAIGQVTVSYNKTTGEATITPEVKNMENYAIDTELEAVLKPYEEDTWTNYMLEVLGQASDDFSAADLGTKPSAFMDLINTVQLWGAYDRTGLNTPDDKTDDKPAQLSISAPLTTGDNANIINKGDIYLGDMFKLYRFENWFYQITMSGEEVHQWLEFAATKIRLDDKGNPYVSAGDLTYYDVIYGEGFSYVIDYKAEPGKRIASMTYNGVEVKADDEFTVVVNNYRYNGGGNYVKWLNTHGCEFAANDPERIIYSTQFDMIQGEDLGQARSLLMDYIREKKTITPEVTSTWKVESSDTVIYFTNDVHGAYENYAYAAAIAGNGDLLIDAGDSIQGSVATTLTNGQCMVDLMKAAGYDVAVPGNHEFDYGFDRFLEVVNGENTPYISANLWDLVNGKAVLPAAKTFEVNGKKIAIVGVTTPETLVKSTPAFFQNEKGEWIYDFCNDTTGEKLYAKVQEAVDAVKKDGADYVILVGHLGIDEQSEPWTSTSVIANTTGIDAVIDGHSHSTFSEVKKNKDGKDVVVAQTGTKLANVGKLTISADGKIEAYNVPVSTDGPADNAVAAAVKAVKDKVDEVSNTVVAKTEVDLTTKDPDTGKRAVRNAETNLGDLCADAYRDLLKTDVAFVNGGGVRADIAKGDITYGNIISVHPFGNTACKIEVTGEQIWQALELGAASYPGESGGFLQVSGIEYTINSYIKSPVVLDETKAFVKLEGEHRVTDVKIGGEPLDVKKTYTLGGHNYMLLSGGDGYTMFKGAKVLAQEVAIDNEVLIKYITGTLKGEVKADSIYANPKGEGRIKVVTAPTFTDVKEGAWYYEYVMAMAEEGIIKGMTPTTFEPEGTLTRAETAMLLYRLAGEPAVEEPATFTDVKEGAWYADAVAWAEDQKIVDGMTPTTFEPDGKVTRAQLVTMLYRAVGEPEVEEAATFTDVAEGKWYSNAIAWAEDKEIVNGMTPTTFEPDGDCLRGQAAKVLCIFKALPAEEPAPEA